MYGAIYFLRTSKSKGKAILLESKHADQELTVNLTAETGWHVGNSPFSEAAQTRNHPVVFSI